MLKYDIEELKREVINLSSIKQEVFQANMELPKKKLVKYTWGNVSAIDRKLGLVVIKPSGVLYDKMKVSDMVVVDLQGTVVEGKLNPSSDTLTHVNLYKAFSHIGGIAHTHSTWATIWAQSGQNIPCLGTTHADYFYGDIICTRKMKDVEIMNDYEKNTGSVIIETLNIHKINPAYCPAVIVQGHGPFTWGSTATEAVHNSVVLEELAKMAYHSLMINPNLTKIDKSLLDKHFLRKHGKNAYYGQK